VEARRRLFKAELELCESDKERVAVHEKIVQLEKESEKVVEKRVEAGRVPTYELLAARVNRLEAEIALERAKAKLATDSK
jgi:outer membrane protein TolC